MSHATRRLAAAALAVTALVSDAPRAGAQGTDFRTFNFYVENDAFVNSDTGYTNGVRLAWSLARSGKTVGALANFGVPWVLAKLHAGRLVGIDLSKTSRVPCQPSDVRADRDVGRCLLLDLGLGQTIYTPDSLIDPKLEPQDRPYAGFLFATVGATTLDSPRRRNARSPFVMTQLSNAVVLGVTGPGSFARETQSLAHWTWSSGSPRPLGWHNQLRGSVQGALFTELFTRPRGWERCNYRSGTGQLLGCNGGVDEKRWFDVTPRAEMVLGTYMLRASLGGVVRAGARFPDFVNIARIPTTKGFGGKKLAGAWRRIVPEPYWWYGFAALDARYVPYNAFIEGGYRDRGADGWSELREIDARRGIREAAVGFSFGNEHMSMVAQHVSRTPEYDVRGAEPARGAHRYVSLSLAIHTKPGTH